MGSRLPLVLVWVWGPHIGLLGSRPGGGKSKGLLDVLPDGHGAQDIEEDEGTVSQVRTHQVAVRKALQYEIGFLQGFTLYICTVGYSSVLKKLPVRFL